MKYVIKTFDELTNHELYQILKTRVDVFVVEQTCPYPEIDDYDQHAIHYFLKEKNNLVAYTRLLPSQLRYNEASIGRVLVTRSEERRVGEERQTWWGRATGVEGRKAFE